MKLIEKTLIVLSILLIAIGLVFDLTRFTLFQLEDFDGFALVVLQIQATLSTLGLSMITIISNAFKQEAYGVSVSDFIMNRNNRFLTLKRIIVISLLLILLGLFEYVRRHLNTVCCFLVVEVGLLIYLLHNVTLIFKSYSSVLERIFSQEIMNSKNGKGLDCFFDAFAKADDIPESMAKDYVGKAEILIDSYLSDKERFSSIADGVSRMVSKLLENNNRNNADSGVGLLQHYYSKYRDYNLFDSNDYLYSVFGTSFREIVDGYHHITRVFDLYKWIPFTILGNQIRVGKTGIDVKAAVDIAGFCARNCCVEGDVFLRNQIDYFIPDNADRIFLGLRDDMDEERCFLVEKAVADFYLSFANELMKAGKGRILSEYCFRPAFSSLMRRERICRYYVIGIIVLCLYYSVFEEDNLVSDSVREGCSYLLSTNWGKMKSFLAKSIFSGDWKAEDHYVIRELLHGKEVSTNGKGKFKIMAGTVNRCMFVLYALCCSCYTEQFKTYVEGVFSREGDYNYRFFVEYPQKAKNLIGSVLRVVDSRYNVIEDAGKNSEVSKIYSVISEVIKKELFKSIMENSERSFEDMGDFEEICNRICRGFEDHVNKETAQFISSLEAGANEISNEITVSEIDIPVGALNQEDIIDYLSDFIDDGICLNILKSIKSHLESSEVESEIESEVETFMGVLSEYDSVIGFGSFYFKNYSLQKKIEDLIETKKNLIVNDVDCYLALFDSHFVSISFFDFSVEIKEYTNEEIKEKEEKLGDSYNVKVINDIYLPFSEEELFDYYHLNKRKLNLKCNMMIQFVHDNIGKLIKIN